MKVPILRRVLLVALTGAIVLAFMIGFMVRQNEQVVLTRFGQPVRVILDPGLYAKWPWPVETVNRVDARLNFYEAQLSESLTKDRRNIIVPVFIGWKVAEPLKFLEALGNEENAKGKLESLVSSAKNTVLGLCDFQELVSANSDANLGSIEAKIAAIVAPQAKASFGISIQKVGIERIMLPEANTSYVFDRMRAERSQFGSRYLAEGRQQADAIRVQTNAQKTILIAEAQKDAEIKRGQGEEEAARIYSKAHSQNPEFYLFLRQLETLKKTVNQNTTLILDANQPPFDLLKQPSTPPPVESIEPKKN